MKMLDKICINAMLRANVAKDKLESFLEEQDGVSNVVATLLILVIVVTILNIILTRANIYPFWSAFIKDHLCALK